MLAALSHTIRPLRFRALIVSTGRCGDVCDFVETRRCEVSGTKHQRNGSGMLDLLHCNNLPMGHSTHSVMSAGRKYVYEFTCRLDINVAAFQESSAQWLTVESI